MYTVTADMTVTKAEGGVVTLYPSTLLASCTMVGATVCFTYLEVDGTRSKQIQASTDALTFLACTAEID